MRQRYIDLETLYLFVIVVLPAGIIDDITAEAHALVVSCTESISDVVLITGG